jgi:subtilisin family serine protease
MAGFPTHLVLPDGTRAPRDATRLLIKLAERASAGAPALTAEVRIRLAALGLQVEGDAGPKSGGGRLFAINHGPDLIWLRFIRKTRTRPSLATPARAFERRLAWMAPVFRLPNRSPAEALFAARPDVLVIDPPKGSEKALAAAIRKHRLIEQVERSRRLGTRRYFIARDAASIAAAIRRDANVTVDLEYVPWHSPFAFDPDDTYFSDQWGMTRIAAPAAWDLETGQRRVLVAVIDSGCDLDHADLRHAYVTDGINAGDPALDGSPIVHAPSGIANYHGTAVVGVIAAALNNAVGMSGLAGGCGIIPIALPTGSTVEMAEAVDYAVAQGASIVNLSVAIGSFWFEMAIRPSIDAAVAAGCVVCASAGNGDTSPLVLPARYPPVMAAGGSDRVDRRWSVAGDGSHWGDEVYDGAPTGVSVTAPAVDIVSTDITGPGGFTPGASPLGDYLHRTATIPAGFGGTSAAAPHLAGVAALVRSAYPALSALDTRRVIERTAEKTGGYAYADVDGYPHGSRHPEMGYGRLNAFLALDLGDVMIRDWPGDTGVEPSRPPRGNFFSTSDVVIRPADDGVFLPGVPGEASMVVRGVEHTASVRVRNCGPAGARAVRVDVRAVPWAGTEFVYPDDWLPVDALHVQPSVVDAIPFDLAAGGERIVRFRFTAAQIDALAGWTDMRWHPCLLAVTTSANDYAFASAPSGVGLQMRRNNLAQRNLTVAAVTGTSAAFPFVIGHPANKDRVITLAIDAGPLARHGSLHLVVDDARDAFPAASKARAFGKGRLKAVRVFGGTPTRLGRRAAIHLTSPRAVVELARPAAGRYAIALVARLPDGAPAGRHFPIVVTQLSGARVTGGVSFLAVT